MSITICSGQINSQELLVTSPSKQQDSENKHIMSVVTHEMRPSQHLRAGQKSFSSLTRSFIHKRILKTSYVLTTCYVQALK